MFRAEHFLPRAEASGRPDPGLGLETLARNDYIARQNYAADLRNYYLSKTDHAASDLASRINSLSPRSSSQDLSVPKTDPQRIDPSVFRSDPSGSLRLDPKPLLDQLTNYGQSIFPGTEQQHRAAAPPQPPRHEQPNLDPSKIYQVDYMT